MRRASSILVSCECEETGLRTASVPRTSSVPGTLEAKVVIQSSDQTMAVNIQSRAPEPDWVRKSIAAVKGPNAASRPTTADEMRA